MQRQAGDADMLKLEHIEKAYQQGKNIVPVLHDITFHVAHGEFVAIMGPSGSGKSTLMNLIGLLDTPTSGSYFFDGTEVSCCSENMLSGKSSTKKSDLSFRTLTCSLGNLLWKTLLYPCSMQA